MIHVLQWDPTESKALSRHSGDLPASISEIPSEAKLWIDLENPTPEEEELIFKRFIHVHPLTLEDITKPRRDPEQGGHFPKVEEFSDYLFVIVSPVSPALLQQIRKTSAQTDPNIQATTDSDLPVGRQRLNKLSRPQLSTVMTHQVLITHHYDALPVVDQVRQFAARHHDCARRGPDYIYHLILDGMVDEYAPVVERIADRLDILETRLFRRPSQDILMRLLHIKRQVSYLRKTLILEREVLARLTRGEFQLVESREIAYYRNVFDHVVRYTELIESAREMVSDLMQTHLSAMSNRLNEIMKVLTMISTVVLPMTLVAGIYGMNFENMPELHSNWGYPMALSLMGVLGLGSLALFKWRRWL